MARPKLLITWEMGENNGHLARDTRIAKLALAQGFEVFLAVPDVQKATDFFDEFLDVTLIQAPLIADFKTTHVPFKSIYHVLWNLGYCDSVALHKSIYAWKLIVEEIAPEFVVYNHSPTAAIAAYIAKVPLLAVGTPFELSALGVKTPQFDNFPVTDGVDRLVLANVNRSLKAFGAKELTSLAELVSGDLLLTTYKDLDTYYPLGSENRIYIGSINEMPHAHTVEWHDDADVRIFVYLRQSHPLTARILGYLDSPEWVMKYHLNVDVVVYCPDLTLTFREAFQRIHFAEGPIELDNFLDGADWCISTGATSIIRSLSKGIPAISVPLYSEQALMADRLEATGLGLSLHIGLQSRHTAEQLQKAVLLKYDYKARAKAFALENYEITQFGHELLTQRLHRN